jgi:hypothetical protein
MCHVKETQKSWGYSSVVELYKALGFLPITEKKISLIKTKQRF